MERHLDILLREPTIGHQLHARLLAAAHVCIARGAGLAVSWPDWRGTPGEFGLLFRVFGTEADLAAYSAAITPLVEANLIRLFPIGTPPATDRQVMFFRDRKLDKFTASRTARRLRRGHDCEPQRTTAPSVRPHFLIMQSQSTQQAFSLYVRRAEAKSASDGGRQYGLGQLVPDF